MKNIYATLKNRGHENMEYLEKSKPEGIGKHTGDERRKKSVQKPTMTTWHTGDDSLHTGDYTLALR
ncbi:uncharacterized protein G2W53_010217 [Senna tora]|uniref:Uncharacterized protein n=1 Tax=Senna tora TaxID=362788 RepID=A0A834WZI7_9FABA|nr:uncharacterized protein G2W53_010217 [Senna tora]